MLFLKNNNKRIISLVFAVVAFIAVFCISFDGTTVYASSCEAEAFEIKNIAVGEGAGQHNMRPTSETANEMKQNKESQEDSKTPILGWIMVGLFFVIGLLMVIFPDFFTELSHFWDNQFLYWAGLGFTLNPSKVTRIIERIFGVIFMLIAAGLIWFLLRDMF